MEALLGFISLAGIWTWIKIIGLLTGILAGQWYLHRWFQQMARTMRWQGIRQWLKPGITLWFVALNIPSFWILGWLLYHGIPYPYLAGPAIDRLPTLVALPFTVWQWSSLACIGVLITTQISHWLWKKSQIWRARRRLAIRAAAKEQPAAPAVSQPASQVLEAIPTPIPTSVLPDEATPLIPRPAVGRREFIQAASLALTTSPFLVSTYGAYVARESYRLERLSLTLPGMPPELRGTTIVQLTDVHAGVFMDHHRLMEFVDVANGLNPDLIVLTGDYVPYSSTCVPLFIGAFRHLRARYGVYATLGNHDLFTNSVDALAEGFRNHNIRLLINEQETVWIRGAKLNLMGITYIPQSRHERLADLTFDAAMRRLEVRDTSILLSHQPNVFPKALERNIPLTISGHTHGGQVKVEFLGQDIAPSRLMTDFTAGLYQLDGSQLYVSRGVGTSGPPVRLGSVPEITQITLV